MNTHRYTEYGQAGIIVILVSVVIFTLGMATAQRVTTDISIAARTEEGVRAFAAAEAAYELALINIAKTPPVTSLPSDWTDSTTNPSVSSNYSAQKIPGSPVEYELADVLLEGNSKTIWLTNQPDDPRGPGWVSYTNRFRIHWDHNVGSDEVEVNTYYDIPPGPVPVTVKREYITTQVPSGEVTIDYAAFPVGARLFFTTIKPVVGAIEDVTVDGYHSSFPAQGYTITASSVTANLQVRRKIVGQRLWGDIPVFMEYVLGTSTTGLEKTN